MVEEKHFYCGKNKVTLENPTVGDLRDALPDDDYKVQFNGRDVFYIHFDQEEKIINLDYKRLDNHYGVRGGGSCSNCLDYDRDHDICNCDPTNCVNYRCPRNPKLAAMKKKAEEVEDKKKETTHLHKEKKQKEPMDATKLMLIHSIISSSIMLLIGLGIMITLFLK